MSFQCKKCRYSATCLVYPHRWTFVMHCTDLTRCKGCGRVWDSRKALNGPERGDGTQVVNLAMMELMPVPPCGEWEVGETLRHIDRCLKCSPYPRTTATESNGNYLPFAK